MRSEGSGDPLPERSGHAWAGRRQWAEGTRFSGRGGFVWVGSQEGVKNGTLEQRGLQRNPAFDRCHCGFGHLDSNGHFQPQFQLGLPILAPGLGSARQATPTAPAPPSAFLQPQEKNPVLGFLPQLCQETVKGLPAGLAGRTPVGGKHCVSDSTTNAYDLT